jgi:uncharacterized membrane protein YfcA
VIEAALFGLVFLIGGLIGAVGIGGVALAPTLNALLGTPLHEAIAIALACFVLSGMVGTVMHRRHAAVGWSSVVYLIGASALGAFVGAMLLPLVPERLLQWSLAGLMVVAGIRAVLRSAGTSEGKQKGSLPQRERLLVVGALAGFGSALTGTGGPLALIPLLLLMEAPVTMAIALGQVIQIPVGISASAGNFISGSLGVSKALPIAALVAAGTFAGAIAGRRIPVRFLRMLVGFSLTMSGLLYAFL